MADKLTPQQHQAVYDRGGNLLVSAAAGSGKTKVLVDRLLSYLLDESQPADLDEFLIITYTKAAATELRGKIARKLTEEIAAHPENRHLQKQMQRLFLTKISTVHGFCGDLLREHAYRLEVAPDFRVADENECQEVRDNVMSELLNKVYDQIHSDDDYRAFVDTQGLGRTDRLVPEIIQRVFDSAQCHMDPDGWLQSCLDAVDVDDISDAGETLWGKFLMEDLFSYLDDQIFVLQKCADGADSCSGFEKPAVVLRDTLFQLQQLRSSVTWDAVKKSGNLDYGRLTFPRKNPNPELSESIKAARNALKKGLEKKLRNFADDSDQILLDLAQSAGATRGLVKLVREFGHCYAQAKKSRRILDFSDLEHRTLDLLRGKSRGGPTAIAREVGRRFREIMVDEYQDSNEVQDAIFSALTYERHNCFMVGDVKQSIYQFRLADPGIFLDKYHRYVPAGSAEAGQGRKVLLSHNFRSGMEILEASNAVFSKCMGPRLGGLTYGEEEMLREGVPHTRLPEPGVEFWAIQTNEDSHQQEADFVAEKIRQMLQDGCPIRSGEGFRHVQPEDIVILLRSPGSVGKYYQRALNRLGIRCASGGSKDLLAAEEIATLRSFLQIIMNPRQDIPLISTLASPVFGFTADDLSAVRSGNKRKSFYDALTACDHPKGKQFLTILSRLRMEARTSTLTGLLETCFLLTRMDSIYGAMPGGTAKLANLQTFFRLAAEFESSSLRDLGQFLDHLDALEARGLIQSESGNGDAVSIMSIHKSKGLEFPVVFLCGLARGFNQESLKAQILCDKKLGLGMSVTDTDLRIRYPSVSKRAIMAKMSAESLSEEMRILYVAMTRARDRMIMTYASKSLESDIQDIALRMDLDGGKLVCMDTNCPGKWVLLTALSRLEAGELHVYGGRPGKIESSDIPWKICVTEASAPLQTGYILDDLPDPLPEGSEQMLGNMLHFSYPYEMAAHTPSKQTATDRKGRTKDEEAAQDTHVIQIRKQTRRIPSFASAGVSAATFGTAMHTVMQFLRFEACGDIQSISKELDRLSAEGFLAQELRNLVSDEKLYRFFSTPIGQKLVCGSPHLREFKFSILEDASSLDDSLQGERILMQGVVDCAILEEDGITILDFKTDRVTEDSLSSAVERYRQQIMIYASALSRIYELPVKEKYLYFFQLDQFVAV